MDNTRDQHPRSAVISSSQMEIKDEGSVTIGGTDTVADALNALSEVANVSASFNDFPSVFRQCNSIFDSNKSADSDEQQSHNSKRGRVPEHPCWEIMQRISQDNCMICRLCSKQIMWINTRNAMQHLKCCNQQIADELERVWQSKLQLRADLNRFSEDSFHFDRGKRRGRTTEHPSWFHFNRIDKRGANCKLCGVRVAYACSGNLMKHLKSRHVPEFVIAQKEWDEILRKKKQLCEIRLMVASGESGNNSPQDFPIYDVDDDDELIGSPISRSASREGDIETQEANEDKTSLEKNFENIQRVEKEEPQQEHMSLETTASASAQPIPGTVTPIIADTSGKDVSETVGKILQSMGVPTSASSSNHHLYDGSRRDSVPTLFTSSTSGYVEGESASRIGAIATRRIQSFVNVLADDLASFPLEKSLLYMRQIRKYMDEKLVESESSTFNSEDDVNIG